MNVTDFTSNNRYIYLPTKKNSRVVLAVDSPQIARCSFELYQPFSSKAKRLKQWSAYAFTHFNHFLNRFIDSHKKAEFIHFLEKKINMSLISSVYTATAKDKFVVQLQSKKGIYGYLKFPVNKNGETGIQKEIDAYAILSKKRIIPKPLMVDMYSGKKFIILPELKGIQKLFDVAEIEKVLRKFYKGKRYKLRDHPRIQLLHEELKKNNLDSFAEELRKLIIKSDLFYLTVYEHGDFAPWNLMDTNNGIIPFDFENFEEHGLEYLDHIKYFYQVGSLLMGLRNKKLSDFIENKIPIPEFNLIMQVFLLKEIVQKSRYGEDVTGTIRLYQMLANAKT